MKCKNCTEQATKVLMWCEHRAYVPSCDSCLETVKKLDCFRNGGLDAIKPVDYILEKQRKRKEKMKTSSIQFAACADEFDKIAASPALIGAGIGAGLSGLYGGLKEWDRRLDEARYNLTPEQKKDLQKGRLARLATGVALGAAAGGVTGYFGGKAVKSLSDEAKKVSDHAGTVLNKSIDRLGEHYKEPFRGDNAKALGQDLATGMKDGMTPGFVKKLQGMFGKKP